MTLGSILVTILVGAIIGALGRLVVPGRQHIRWWLTILIGIAAAFLGTLIATWLGVNNTRGVDWIELLIQIGVAAILVSLVASRGGRRRITRL